MKTNREVTALLVACARLEDATEEDLSRTVAGVRDWQNFVAEAEYHNVIALVNRHLRDSPETPKEVRSALRERGQLIAQEALALTSGLVDVSRSFEAADITAVSFKGPLLSITVYGDLGLRDSIDLDFVVRPRDALRAHEVLKEAGFRGGPESPAMLRAWVRYGRSITMARDGLIVDLQWAADLSDRHREAPFSRLAYIEVGGVSIPIFSDEDLLLQLCIHGGKHLWSHLCWVVDIAELIAARPRLDWNSLIAEASRSGTLRRLMVGLALAERLGSVRVAPDAVSGLKADPEVSGIAGALWSRMFGEHTTRFPLNRLQLRMRERRMDRFVYAWRLGVTPTDDDWSWYQLPGRLWWLYPILRPARLGAKYGRLALGRLSERR